MKKYLISRLGKFYKANLHTHTTISDGKFTPEEVKEAYKAAGYSIVAFTDHEVIVPHPELKSEDFLPITSYEISVYDGWNPYAKCYHLNLYFPNENTNVSRTFSDMYGVKNSKLHITDEMRKYSAGKRRYTKEYVQWIIDTAKEEGALVSYNHPVWSLQSKDDYSGIHGIWGVEWYNTSADTIGYLDTYQPLCDLLCEGERCIYPIAADDSHSERDRFGGWVMVRSRSLDYDSVFDALRRGDFYSSNGPEIKSLALDGNTLKIKTSAAKRITVITNARWRANALAAEGESLRGADFDITRFLSELKEFAEDKPMWIALEVIDKNGKTARSRAYFLDELI